MLDVHVCPRAHRLCKYEHARHSGAHRQVQDGRTWACHHTPAGHLALAVVEASRQRQSGRTSYPSMSASMSSMSCRRALVHAHARSHSRIPSLTISLHRQPKQQRAGRLQTGLQTATHAVCESCSSRPPVHCCYCAAVEHPAVAARPAQAQSTGMLEVKNSLLRGLLLLYWPLCIARMASWRRLRAHAVLLPSSMAGRAGANSCHVRWGTRFVASHRPAVHVHVLYRSRLVHLYQRPLGTHAHVKDWSAAATAVPLPGLKSDLRACCIRASFKEPACM